jgi:UDP-GlcNAc:undecaprenyl-phosphate GlcNAc-1-phosphate transferase
MLEFPANTYLLAFAGAFGTALAALPLWRAWCRRTGLVDDPGHRKIHRSPIPLAGGLAVFTGLLVPVLCAAFVVQAKLLDAATLEKIAHGLGRRYPQLLAIFGGASAMLLLGWLDDKYELRPAVKFGGQMLVALATALAGVRATMFVDNFCFSIGVTMFWILAVTNAVNIMDNMNGLCAGLGGIAAGWFALGAIAHGQYLVALLALAVLGALLGFLPFNYPRASVFLGDSGSHLVGYLMAVLALLPHFYSPLHAHRWAVLTPLLVLAVPLADMAWVVQLRWRMGKPFYVGDNNHLSHRLTRRGLAPAQAVAFIWLLALVAGGLSAFFW